MPQKYIVYNIVNIYLLFLSNNILNISFILQEFFSAMDKRKEVIVTISQLQGKSQNSEEKKV